MAKWSLKNRNNTVDKQPQMPPELSDYYNAEKRDHMWATWLLGLATLIVTILLAVLLFLGVRWVVDRFNGDEVDAPSTTQEETTNDTSDDSRSEDDNDEAVDNSDDQTLAVGDSNDSQSEPSEENGVVTDRAATTDEPLPDTGPGDVVAVFLAVSILGALAHNQLQSRKSF